jgi:ribonuclease-3|tara:strand:+ start:345 stop:1013 length:669 start_codon:yes stop_codon:yes gene_type:complete
MISNINNFEKYFKIKFKDKSLLTKALTHKSTHQTNNNEKLEFLGDRVLGLVISKKLFDLYPNETEGVLDKKFAMQVNRKTCSKIGWSLGIQKFILLGNKKKLITTKDEKILSDCCEAIIGAIYIDQGFSYVQSFILKAWKKNIENSNITIFDSKTRLQEYSLKKFKKLPIYKIVSSAGPKHNPIYKISVSITNSKNFIGYGRSKQQAQQDGASNLLKEKNIK